MIVKPGVRLLGVKPETVAGMMVVDGVFARGPVGEFIVTSVVEGAHQAGSLHYAGLAFDCSIHGVTDPAQLALDIRAALGSEWDVLLEDAGTANEHIHCEFQPKQGLQSIP